MEVNKNLQKKKHQTKMKKMEDGSLPNKKPKASFLALPPFLASASCRKRQLAAQPTFAAFPAISFSRPQGCTVQRNRPRAEGDSTRRQSEEADGGHRLGEQVFVLVFQGCLPESILSGDPNILMLSTCGVQRRHLGLVGLVTNPFTGC